MIWLSEAAVDTDLTHCLNNKKPRPPLGGKPSGPRQEPPRAAFNQTARQRPTHRSPYHTLPNRPLEAMVNGVSCEARKRRQGMQGRNSTVLARVESRMRTYRERKKQ